MLNILRMYLGQTSRYSESSTKELRNGTNMGLQNVHCLVGTVSDRRRERIQSDLKVLHLDHCIASGNGLFLLENKRSLV